MSQNRMRLALHSDHDTLRTAQQATIFAIVLVSPGVSVCIYRPVMLDGSRNLFRGLFIPNLGVQDKHSRFLPSHRIDPI
jgi:hypothetical protein